MVKQLALTIGGQEIPAPQGIPQGGIGSGNIIIGNAITILLVITVLFSLFMFLLAGINWITSQGDKTKLQSARNKMIYAIIGLLVVFFSFFIISLIGNIFGTDLLNTTIDTQQPQNQMQPN